MTLPLYAEDQLVAVIESGHEGPRLRYEAAWRAGSERFPISLGMPLTSPEYGPDIVVPWLMNLLPEGDRPRRPCGLWRMLGPRKRRLEADRSRAPDRADAGEIPRHGSCLRTDASGAGLASPSPGDLQRRLDGRPRVAAPAL